MTALRFDNLIADENTFGLDISNSRVKVMWVVERKQGELSLNGFGSKNLPASAIVGGVVRRSDVVAEAIREAIFNASPKPIKTPYAVCSIPQEKVLIKIEEFPNLEKEKLRQAVSYKVPSILGMSVDKVYWDWHRLDLKKDSSTVRVLIAAVEKDVVDSYVETIFKAGVVPLVLEMNVSAAARLTLADPKYSKVEQPVILVNVGNSNSTIAIHHQGGVRFTSSVNIGGNQLIKIISTHLKKTPAEAMEYLRETGLKSKSKELLTELSLSLMPLAKEIQSAISYYDKTPDKGDDIEMILLHGDGSILKNLDKYLSSEYFPTIKVQYANPRVNLIPIPQFIIHEKIYPHVVVTGLAVRDFGVYKGLDGINLLPESAQGQYVTDVIRRKVNSIVKIFTVNAIALAMFLFGAWFLLRANGDEIDGIIETKESVLRGERIQEISTEIEALNNSLISAASLINIKLDWIKVFDQLLLAIPDDITLSNVDIYIDDSVRASAEPRWVVDIYGVALDKQSVVDLSDGLLAQNIFDDVTFPISNFSSATRVEFQVNASIKFSSLLKNPGVFEKKEIQELELNPINVN